MKIITATLLLVISLLGILGTAFLYLGELTQGKGRVFIYSRMFSNTRNSILYLA
uniref:hypothetical protein n=1 Tax=Lactococcus sp. TaxID=44273 RepID=UPI0034DDC80C